VFHVVLFEPEIPPNTGNVIRLCANTGAVLHLIKPLGFRLDDKSLQRSGLDYHDLASVKVHANFEACLSELGATRVFAVETGSRSRYSDVAFRAGDAFLFGPETRGLPSGAMQRIGWKNSLYIPMLAESRSINLSNSVALVLFEAWRQVEFSGAGAVAGSGSVSA
jgi:tRNA (cytidine/uridine-2'-O-)-methyltransferase